VLDFLLHEGIYCILYWRGVLYVRGSAAYEKVLCASARALHVHMCSDMRQLQRHETAT
jgi:hypothetical protein